MAVNDSEFTRIKASAAKKLMQAVPEGTSYITSYLWELLEQHDLKALVGFKRNFAMPNNTSIYTLSSALDGSVHVLNDYAENIRKNKMPAELGPLNFAVILSLREDGKVEVATWGEDTATCSVAGKWGTKLMDEMPQCPFRTWFGTGNEGIPIKLDKAAITGLTPSQQAYVARNTHPNALEALADR